MKKINANEVEFISREVFYYKLKRINSNTRIKFLIGCIYENILDRKITGITELKVKDIANDGRTITINRELNEINNVNLITLATEITKNLSQEEYLMFNTRHISSLKATQKFITDITKNITNGLGIKDIYNIGVVQKVLDLDLDKITIRGLRVKLEEENIEARAETIYNIMKNSNLL